MSEMTNEFIASVAFLESHQWRQVRFRVLSHYGSRCMCCGAVPKGNIVMNVDHIKPRKTHPELALEFDNLQVLCNVCNHGKGNWSDIDLRGNASKKKKESKPPSTDLCGFVVTKKWLDNNKTPNGGYTWAQITIVTGTSDRVLWEGWQNWCIGRVLTLKEQKMFEAEGKAGSKAYREAEAVRLANKKPVKVKRKKVKKTRPVPN
jgi:5-methylcytosine-specific restriction endonuclease McrA